MQKPPTESSPAVLRKSYANSFAERRDDIFKRIKGSAEKCRETFKERRELATEREDCVAEFCESLHDAFSYGLRQQELNFVATAASLFQNMQEIVKGNITVSNNETTFWDFCCVHLTSHEKERFENLKQVWTKLGRGRAFLRAALNEHSLSRYLLTWLDSRDVLTQFYTPWSLMLDEEMTKELPSIINSLNGVLFALSVDAIDLNSHHSKATISQIQKTEPVIFAPSPIPVASASVKSKRKVNVIEIPTEDLSDELLKITNNNNNNNNNNNSNSNKNSTVKSQVQDAGLTNSNIQEAEEPQEPLKTPPPDDIGPELEFLKQPLPDFYTSSKDSASTTRAKDEKTTSVEVHMPGDSEIFGEEEDKSDTSSQYSKSSSTNSSAANQIAILEEKLKEMTERYSLLETRVAQLSLENRQLVRRLTRHFNESGIDPTSSFATNFLITIPTVKLIKSKHGTSSYYAYEVHITMRHHLDHWSVLRRYRDFYKLHKSLLRTHPVVASIDFPPKKHFGNKNSVFVDERRQQLQIYLLNLVESLPQLEICRTKADLQRVFPFLRER